MRGVCVLPLEWLVGEIQGARDRHARAAFNIAANALADATAAPVLAAAPRVSRRVPL